MLALASFLWGSLECEGVEGVRNVEEEEGGREKGSGGGG